MNKAQIIDAIASEANLTKKQSKRFLDSGIKIVGRALKNEKVVIIQGVAKFTVVERQSRTGRNPNNGAPIVIKAMKVVKFKPNCPPPY